MALVRTVILIMVMIPVLFVTGNVLSYVDDLGPVSVGPSQNGLYRISEIGESLKGATEGLFREEVNIVRHIISGIGIENSGDIAEILHRIKSSADKSI